MDQKQKQPPEKIQLYLNDLAEPLASSASARGVSLSAEIRRRLADSIARDNVDSSANKNGWRVNLTSAELAVIAHAVYASHVTWRRVLESTKDKESKRVARVKMKQCRRIAAKMRGDPASSLSRYDSEIDSLITKMAPPAEPP